jgi:hypothetical protein
MNNMDFLKTYPKILDQKICSQIIECYTRDAGPRAKRTTDNLMGAVREWTVDSNTFWDSLFERLSHSCDELLDDYFSYSSLLVKEAYYLNHMTIMHHAEGLSIPYHYDAEVCFMNGQEYIRNFAILVYLNDDFDGGELIFPMQKKAIKPEIGLGLVFPTSFMYPHITSPALGSDRYVLRLGFYFKKEAIKESSERAETL